MDIHHKLKKNQKGAGKREKTICLNKIRENKGVQTLAPGLPDCKAKGGI